LKRVIPVTPHRIQRVRQAEQQGARAAADQEPEQGAEHGVVAVLEQRFGAGLGQVGFSACAVSRLTMRDVSARARGRSPASSAAWMGSR
jgi:hypothetical protein